MMKENTRSLGLYFKLLGLMYLIGAVFAISGAMQMTGVHLEIWVLFFGVAVLAIAMAYLYVGFKLESLLAYRPAVPLRLAALVIFLSILRLNVISILVNIYIFYQLKRLATEAAPVTESRVLD